jgi:hypothetical protein
MLMAFRESRAIGGTCPTKPRPDLSIGNEFLKEDPQKRDSVNDFADTLTALPKAEWNF